jgi:hypothetical protein
MKNLVSKWWALALGALLCTGQACIIEEVESEKAGSGGSGAGNSVEPKLPGQRCGCDSECAGDGAVCFLGMCTLRAQAPCPEPNSDQGCEPGFKCFNSDILVDTGLCLPVFDPATCELGESRHGVCSPTRADGCDPACGAACVPDQTLPNTAGAACVGDAECSFHPEGACYASEESGWLDGYCLAFGCNDDAECGGPDKGCLPAASDGSGVCMNRCGMDLDCRAGYICRTIKDDAEQRITEGCFAGCDEAASCPAGNVCVGKICVDEKKACGPTNPFGWCPKGFWCDNGECSDQKFVCGADGDMLEPNDSREKAVDAPMGETLGLTSCAGNDDWYRVVVPAGKLVRVGISFQHAAGDIDLVAYDSEGQLMGSRVPGGYPYSYRDQETDTEFFGFHSTVGETFYVRVVGYGSANSAAAENLYALKVDHYDYKDGGDCTSEYSFDECVSQAPGGAKLLPFPFPNASDDLGDLYQWDTYANYRFARREMLMMIRHALAETAKAFPGTTPLGLIDVCQIDGITPGYDVGSPRHPETTHDQGGNIDIAYFQTDGNNSAEIVCGDGSSHADGFCSSAATEKHIVDLPRQAFFMASLYKSSRIRVIGVDTIIAPLLLQAAKDLNSKEPTDPQYISNSALSGFSGKMASGSGWPYHHHHIHLSLQWWSAAETQSAAGHDHSGSGSAQAHSPFMPMYGSHQAPRNSSLDQVWPPVGRVH